MENDYRTYSQTIIPLPLQAEVWWEWVMCGRMGRVWSGTELPEDVLVPSRMGSFHMQNPSPCLPGPPPSFRRALPGFLLCYPLPVPASVGFSPSLALFLTISSLSFFLPSFHPVKHPCTLQRLSSTGN